MTDTYERPHLSCTSLKQLSSCALQFRLSRLDGVEPSHTSPALILGSAYHTALANALLALKEGEDVTLKQLTAWFDEAWESHVQAESVPIRWTAKVTEENQLELGRSLVAAWFEQGYPWYKAAKQIVAVEMSFEIRVASPLTGEVIATPLHGFIDAIVQTEDGIVIVEHKTAASASSYDGALIESDLQPTIYVEAARQLGLNNAKFRYEVITKSKKRPKLSIIDAPRNTDDLERLHWMMRQAERLIQSGVYMPASADWKCSSCSYRTACRRAHADIVTPDPEPAVAAAPAA